MDRRRFLRAAGGIAVTCQAGFATADQVAPAYGVRRAKSVIVVFASGGQSQLDMWDPKPEAPEKIRGEFRPISTSVPGTIVCEHLPRLSTLADKYTLIRSMSHADLDHGSAVYLALTGQYHPRISSNPTPKPTDHPSMMSVYKRIQPLAGSFDQAVQINGPAIVAPQDIAPGQFGGFLGRDFDPMFLGNVNSDDIAVPGLITQQELSSARIQQRGELLEAMDRYRERPVTDTRITDLQGQYRKAFQLLSDRRTQKAFDLSQEPESLRLRYGRNRAGQSCLLARRLAEAGVPLITVVWNHHNRGQDNEPANQEAHGWDTHNDIFDVLRNSLLPRFDQSFSTLLEDLEMRGMLDDTLVVCMGEFGRAPLVALEPRFAGASPGRKHWASAYSVLLAGAGVAKGKIVGKTDRQGAYPVSESFGPWDLSATILAALGVDPAGHFQDAFGRPYPISIGTPISAVYAG
ncbi:MAG: DUF1501 domain-containing protein [Planctomycetales bacterium]